LHGDDVGARNHDVDGAPLAQAEDVLQHRDFARRQANIGCAALEHFAQIGAKRFRLPAEQCPYRTREPAFAVGTRGTLRRRNRDRQIARAARGLA
jgi:hypothetical protein